MRTRWNGLVVGTCLTLLAASAAPPTATAQVNVRLQRALNQVEGLLGETFGRSVPLPSASSGVSYAFDPATGNFQRSATTFGQVYLDRADPLGNGRVNVSFVTSTSSSTRSTGSPPTTCAIRRRSRSPARPRRPRSPHLRRRRRRASGAARVTYGVTDDLEASIALPARLQRPARSRRQPGGGAAHDGRARAIFSRASTSRRSRSASATSCCARSTASSTRAGEPVVGLLLPHPDRRRARTSRASASSRSRRRCSLDAHLRAGVVGAAPGSSQRRRRLRHRGRRVERDPLGPRPRLGRDRAADGGDRRARAPPVRARGAGGHLRLPPLPHAGLVSCATDRDVRRVQRAALRPLTGPPRLLRPLARRPRRALARHDLRVRERGRAR